MAEIVRVEGEEYKRRSAWGAWGLTLVTVGIYGFVWYYKINDEARRYLRDSRINPWVALVAILLGWVLIVPPFVSYYRTGERIGRMQEKAGIQANRIIPILALIAAIFISLHVVYDQSALNKVWDVEKTRDASVAPEAGAPPIPPPPSG